MDITLRKDAFLLWHVKQNFISNRFQSIAECCNDDIRKQENISEFQSFLIDNGYYKNHCREAKPKKKQRKPKPHKIVNFKLPFVNDRCNHKVNKLIDKY